MAPTPIIDLAKSLIVQEGRLAEELNNSEAKPDHCVF